MPRAGQRRGPCLGLQITVELKVPLSGYQALMYAWIQATNTKRMPEDQLNREGRLLGFAAQRNRVMELRKVGVQPRLVVARSNGRFLCYEISSSGWHAHAVFLALATFARSVLGEACKGSCGGLSACARLA